MAQFKAIKKPVPISCIQFDGENMDEINNFIGEHPLKAEELKLSNGDIIAKKDEGFYICESERFFGEFEVTTIGL